MDGRRMVDEKGRKTEWFKCDLEEILDVFANVPPYLVKSILGVFFATSKIKNCINCSSRIFLDYGTYWKSVDIHFQNKILESLPDDTTELKILCYPDKDPLGIKNEKLSDVLKWKIIELEPESIDKFVCIYCREYGSERYILPSIFQGFVPQKTAKPIAPWFYSNSGIKGIVMFKGNDKSNQGYITFGQAWLKIDERENWVGWMKSNFPDDCDLEDLLKGDYFSDKELEEIIDRRYNFIPTSDEYNDMVANPEKMKSENILAREFFKTCRMMDKIPDKWEEYYYRYVNTNILKEAAKQRLFKECLVCPKINPKELPTLRINGILYHIDLKTLNLARVSIEDFILEFGNSRSFNDLNQVKKILKSNVNPMNQIFEKWIPNTKDRALFKNFCRKVLLKEKTTPIRFEPSIRKPYELLISLMGCMGSYYVDYDSKDDNLDLLITCEEPKNVKINTIMRYCKKDFIKIVDLPPELCENYDLEIYKVNGVQVDLPLLHFLCWCMK